MAKKIKEELLSKADTEKRVFDYLQKNTPKDSSKFNPIKLGVVGIAENTNLAVEDVEEALENLTKGSPRVEKVDAHFFYWLPLDEDSEKMTSSPP